MIGSNSSGFFGGDAIREVSESCRSGESLFWLNRVMRKAVSMAAIITRIVAPTSTMPVVIRE